MRRVAILLIKLYQVSLGKLLGGRCRFHPSCSNYALECFQRHSFFRALGLTLWRIFRCQPLFEGGYDPVPEPRRKGKGNG